LTFGFFGARIKIYFSFIFMEKTTRKCRRCLQEISLNALTAVYKNKLRRYQCSQGCQWKRWSLSGEIVRVRQCPSTYIVTAAQNNTLVNRDFLASLRSFCKLHKAKLIVIPCRYRNPTPPQEADRENIWYDPAIVSDLIDERFYLPKIVVLADISINPTAVNPLSGMEALTGGRSAIVAHPQIAFKCVPTPKGQLPLLLTTTGAITMPNYSSSKAGKKGEFHHSFGVVVIQSDRDKFHLRNISAQKDGSFIDLGIKYNRGTTDKARTKALVMGDLHIGVTCPKTILGTKKLIKHLQPERIVLHDAFDGQTVNHHETSNPFAKYSHTFDSLTEELAENERVLKEYRSLCDELVLVNSNHNDFLYRWLQRIDWKTLNKETARFYLEAASAVTQDRDSDIYGKEMKRRGVDARFLELDESYLVEGVELGFHGHLGSNGSRPSDKQYARTGMKTIIGHRHSPGIEKGCYVVGTSTELVLGYVRGLSSWLNTHCLIYENGKRQLIHLIEGEYAF
jgi:hypothetical protein